MPPLWIIGWRFLKETKLEPPHDTAIPLLSIIYSDKTNSKRYGHAYVHSNTVYNSQSKETA